MRSSTSAFHKLFVDQEKEYKKEEASSVLCVADVSESKFVDQLGTQI